MFPRVTPPRITAVRLVKVSDAPEVVESQLNRILEQGFDLATIPPVLGQGDMLLLVKWEGDVVGRDDVYRRGH